MELRTLKKIFFLNVSFRKIWKIRKKLTSNFDYILGKTVPKITFILFLKKIKSAYFEKQKFEKNH